MSSPVVLDPVSMVLGQLAPRAGEMGATVLNSRVKDGMQRKMFIRICKSPHLGEEKRATIHIVLYCNEGAVQCSYLMLIFLESKKLHGLRTLCV